MGFILGNVIPLLYEHKRRPFTGHVLCLGMPDVYFTYNFLLEMAEVAKVSLDKTVPISPSHNPDFAAKGFISGETLFKSLGFNYVSVLDCSAFEGAEIIFDLNDSDLPPQIESNYDVIIDHGTIEHIFHIPNCLNNIFKMLRIDGRVIHSSPASNYLDHGFYMFSPTFYYDFYTTNHWEINTIKVYQMRNNDEPVFYSEYAPGWFDCVSYGGLEKLMYGTICIATKTQDSTGKIIPQQSYYTRLKGWQKDQLSGVVKGIPDTGPKLETVKKACCAPVRTIRNIIKNSLKSK